MVCDPRGSPCSRVRRRTYPRGTADGGVVGGGAKQHNLRRRENVSAAGGLSKTDFRNINSTNPSLHEEADQRNVK